jgi:chemotaxis protein CheX
MIAEVNTPNLEPHMAEQVRLVTEIFPIMAGIEIALAPLPWPPNEPVLLAWVNYGGEWKGAMVLACTLPLAFAFSAQLMSIPVPLTLSDDVCDSVAELANTIAGNFKALLPSGCSMSVPIVALQTQDPLPATNRELLCKTVFAA